MAGEFGSAAPEWGRPASPLGVDGLVVVAAGGSPDASLVAFDAETGGVAWQGGSDQVGYSSPTLLTLAGRRQIVIFNRASVAGHAVETGEVLWSYPWSARQPNVALPVAVGDDRLLVSSGYGEGSRLLRIEPEAEGLVARLEWESPRLKAKFTNVVVHEGFVYGLDDGVMVCLDPATGERCWKRGRSGHGRWCSPVTALDPDLDGDVGARARPGRAARARPLHRLRRQDLELPGARGSLLLLRNPREAALFELPSGRRLGRVVGC